MSSDRAASALRWWRDAGVDALVREEPRDWLAASPPTEPARPQVAPEPAPEPAPAPPLPDDLERFRAWLAETDDLPGAAPGSARLLPIGDPGAGLMVLVDMPAPEDIAAGSLLAGEAGALFDRMLAAIGLTRDRLYLAALSPVRSPTGMLDPAAARRLADIARHHVGLVAPRALLLFGDACTRALLGASVAKTRARWNALETPDQPVRTIATIRPAKLLVQPALKKLAWEDLKLLKEELEP